MKNLKQTPAAKTGWLAVGVIAAMLVVLFWRSFLPEYVHFSNDGPLGVQNAAWVQMPGGITGMWVDLNYLGQSGGAYTPGITALLHVLLTPLGYAKFYAPIGLFILGLGAWTFFRQLKLSPLAAALGALAAVLNSTYFSTACWGLASHEIAIGMNFLALALVVGCTTATPTSVRWTRLALAGLCVGINVMEAADIGALFSMLVAIVVFFHSLTEGEGAVVQKAVRGVGRVAVVAVFAGFIAVQTVLSLVGTSVQGVAGNAQDTESKAAHWDWATQWSLPKAETFGLLVPGLFGYKLETPKDMQPSLRDSYRSGVYWGGAGRDPAIDRYFDAGSQGQQPQGFMRFTGGGNYCGILVLLIAGWAIAQAFRRQNSLFADAQKRMIQFWAVVMLLCLLFAWGRFAPFYALLYHLPYFSTIRNPAKFLIFFSWALVIIFAYGVHALNRRYLDPAAMKAADLNTQFKNWWAKASGFDRKWTFASVGLFGASALGWLIYMAQKPALISYLQKVGFGDTDPTHETSAPAIAAFSLGQAGWALALLAVAVGLVLLVITGYFNGPRAKTGVVLLGGFLIFDMGRANLPWLVHWDYKQKYEVGSLNPVVKFLTDKPYEHRVAGLPFRTPQGLERFEELYRIEWMQHHFPYYNIQSLDIVQMPRMPEDMKAYKEALAPRGDAATAPLMTREWLLTNTRYLLGPAGYLEVMNQQLDPGQNRFRIIQRFSVLPKPGIPIPNGISADQFAYYLPLEKDTAFPNTDGPYALFEFTGALPRAKLYSNWQVNTNDSANLKLLGDLSFDPAKTVLVSTPAAGLPALATNGNSDSVEFKSYQTKHIVFAATNSAPSVLLLNDKFDPQWNVTVDGKPAELLRCNYLMRGVYLPTAGQHMVEFNFTLPHRPLYVTLAAIGLGMLLCGFLFYSGRRNPTPAV
jgi:hypothetical protein